MQRNEESLKKLVSDVIDSYYNDLLGIFSSPEGMDELNRDLKNDPDMSDQNGDEIIIPILKSLSDLRDKIFSDSDVTQKDIPAIDHLFTALVHYGLKNGIDLTQDLPEGSSQEDLDLEMDLVILASNLHTIKEKVKDEKL